MRPASRQSSPPDGLCFLHTFQLCNISFATIAFATAGPFDDFESPVEQGDSAGRFQKSPYPAKESLSRKSVIQVVGKKSP